MPHLFFYAQSIWSKWNIFKKLNFVWFFKAVYSFFNQRKSSYKSSFINFLLRTNFIDAIKFNISRWNRSRIKSTQVEERKSHRRKSSFLMSPHSKEQHHAETLKNDIVGNNKLDETKDKSESSRVDLSKEIKPWLHHSRRLR